MSSTLIIVRTEYATMPAIETLRTYHEKLAHELETVPGYEGGHVWINSREPGRHLIIYRYRDNLASEAGLKVVTTELMLRESGAIHSGPANVMRVTTVKEFGSLKEELSGCPYLSLAVRVAEPGYAKELEEDLDRVFQESRHINGFSGYIVGYHDSLEEEVVGIASWDSEAAFLASVPDGIIASVNGYRSAW